MNPHILDDGTHLSVKNVPVNLYRGLHLRPCVILSNIVSKYDPLVSIIEREDIQKRVSADSVMGILTLMLPNSSEVHVYVGRGDRAEELTKRIYSFFADPHHYAYEEYRFFQEKRKK
jgi:phosphotransferase system HPr (HPr) family protein